MYPTQVIACLNRKTLDYGLATVDNKCSSNWNKKYL